MADLTPKVISELPTAGAHNGQEILALSQGGYAKKSTIADLVYPVGSIYMSVNNTTPSTLFGGTWVQIKDTFLLSAGDTYTAGDTGGEATHTLAENEMPAHTHRTVDAGTDPILWPYAGSTSGYAINGTAVTNGGIAVTTETGGGAAHNNMPPYLAVYMWKRTA